MKRKPEPNPGRPTVLITPPLKWRLIWDGERSDDAGTWGLTKAKTGEILLDDSAPPDRQRVTLLHEWFHTENQHLTSADALNDRQIQVLGPALLRMMLANPGVVEWLMAGEEGGIP